MEAKYQLAAAPTTLTNPAVCTHVKNHYPTLGNPLKTLAAHPLPTRATRENPRIHLSENTGLVLSPAQVTPAYPALPEPNPSRLPEHPTPKCEQAAAAPSLDAPSAACIRIVPWPGSAGRRRSVTAPLSATRSPCFGHTSSVCIAQLGGREAGNRSQTRKECSTLRPPRPPSAGATSRYRAAPSGPAGARGSNPPQSLQCDRGLDGTRAHPDRSGHAREP